MLPCLPACDGALRAFGPSGEGVEAVLACMESHLSNASVQATACWSMVNLALIAKQKKALVQKGGVLAIVRAMARHPQDIDVHFRAMFALINLVTPDVTVEKTIQPDTMKVRTFRQVRYIRSVQKTWALFRCRIFFVLTLRCVITTERGLHLLFFLQAVVAIVVSAIQAFSNIVAIVNRGCLVLHNIALDPGHFNALVAIGAPEELVQAICKYPSDALLCQCATGTLRRLNMGGVLNDRVNVLGLGIGMAQAAQAV